MNTNKTERCKPTSMVDFGCSGEVQCQPVQLILFICLLTLQHKSPVCGKVHIKDPLLLIEKE